MFFLCENPKCRQSTFIAAYQGHLACLEDAHNNGFTWDPHTIWAALRNQHTECAIYAINNGGPWNRSAEWGLKCLDIANGNDYERFEFEKPFYMRKGYNDGDCRKFTDKDCDEYTRKMKYSVYPLLEKKTTWSLKVHDWSNWIFNLSERIGITKSHNLQNECNDFGEAIEVFVVVSKSGKYNLHEEKFYLRNWIEAQLVWKTKTRKWFLNVSNTESLNGTNPHQSSPCFPTTEKTIPLEEAKEIIDYLHAQWCQVGVNHMQKNEGSNSLHTNEPQNTWSSYVSESPKC